MKIVSWNINGVRACAQNGLLDFIRNESPDIIGLQEVKALESENPIALDLAGLGYRIFWNAADRRGYSGTAIFSRLEPVRVSVGLGTYWDDREGRVVTAEYPHFTVVNVYTPNSKDTLERLPERMEWDRAFADYLRELERTKPVIFCGDLNVAHRPIDLANPKQNEHSHGFTPEERAGMDRFIEYGFIDTFRHLHPDEPGHYSWWSYFARSRSRNIGWRLDYILISSALREHLRDASILSTILGSDHCPVVAVLDI